MIRMVIKKGMMKMEKEPKTICDDCIHADVCGAEDNFEPDYRRWSPCLAMLRSFSESQYKWHDLAVLHYGH